MFLQNFGSTAMLKVNTKSRVAVGGITVFRTAFLFLGLGICGCGGSSNSSTTKPIVFVHGYAGSADQFESQALRFASNGYPASYISGYEYDTTSVSGSLTTGFTIPAQILSELDAYIDSVLTQTSADKVYLLGHSLGTAVSQAYLNDATHAAKVARYVNIDGQENTTLPGGVPTLALWAELSVPGTVRSIGGATNVTLAGMTHVQAATSSESFVEIYKFFQNNKQPSTTDILGESANQIELAGRVITFLTNFVPAGLTLDVYEVNKGTGARIRSTPDYSTSINADGEFAFAKATAGSSYEFHLTSANPNSSHYYYEPFIRSDYLIRLKYIPPFEMSSLWDENVNHSNLVVIRDKEFIGLDSMSPNEDSLQVNSTELCKGVLPQNGVLGTPIALFVFDQGSDGQSNLSGPITTGLVASLPFIAALDFYIPAADPPDSTIPIVLERRNTGKTQVVNVPNWRSTTDTITVQLMDY
jgi:pimeloyl-ACP methyl ester carboxylesterase